MHLFIIGPLCALVCIAPLFGGAPKLQEVKHIAQEMLELHVDHKTFSPLLAKRSLVSYIDQFDPDKHYLLADEVHSFFEPSDSLIQQVVTEFERSEFSTYALIQKTVIQAIQRARKLRALIKTELLQKKELQDIEPLRKISFCHSSEELYTTARSSVEAWLASYAKEKKLTKLDLEERLKAIDFYEKKQRQHEETYLENKETLASHILFAIASSFDPHTRYFTSEEAFSVRAALCKEICGVGLYLKDSVDGPQVTQIIKDSALGRSALIEPGDILTQIDDKETKTLYFSDVLKLIEGKEHSKVHLVFQKPTGTYQHISVTREKIPLQEERLELSYELFGSGVIGKIYIPSFYDNGSGVNISKDVQEALSELASIGPIYGLILDLRDNKGGFLHQAVKTASLFLRQGVIVIAEYAEKKIEYRKDLDLKSCYEGPMIVLTSKASASSAEILAQALKEGGAALLVGDENTYGKGSIQYQTVTHKDSPYFYKVTVGRYSTPSGKSMQMDGVEVDLHVPTAYAPYNMGEKFLKYPLSGQASHKNVSLQEGFKLPQYIHRRDQLLQEVLPILKVNSKKRLSADRNFTAFLESIKHTESTQKPRYGREDLPMKEAVQIVKDMIFMTRRLS